MSHASDNEQTVESGGVLIPLNRLKKSPNNARKTPHAKAHIEALAASIDAKGMLQNIVVEPERDEAGAPTGFYLVSIGEGRRLAQMLRVKRKQIPDAEPIRCVIDSVNDSHEISLDENVTRAAMSVMDEVEAFAALVDDGMNVEDVARRFGCTARLVEQRLALARLSPKIRAAYRKGDINLDVARAFAINDDHGAQERVFKQFAKPITHAASVRSALTQGRIPAEDRLARFVGGEAYEAAGGRRVRDLFEPDFVFFEDGDLLQRLAGERLDHVREALCAEGWGWAEVQLRHCQIEGLAGERLAPRQRRLKPAEKAEIAALETALSDIEAKLEEAEADNPLWADRDEVETKLDALREATRVFDKKAMAHAGALVTLDHNGALVVTRGLIKRADVKAIAKLRNQNAPPLADDDDALDGSAVDNEAADAAHDGPRLTKALVRDLTIARTRGLRASLALNPQVALALLVSVLTRRSASHTSLVGVGIVSHPVGFEDDDAFSRARTDIISAAAEDEAALLGACLAAPVETLLATLATLVAETIDFSHGGATHEDRQMQAISDALAAALDLDMTRHWQANAEFWEKAPKAMALQALERTLAKLTAKKRTATLAGYAKMKKSELAKTAAASLSGSGWLPDLLVTPAREPSFVVTPDGKAALAKAHAAAA